MYQLVAFAGLSAVLIYISRASLRAPRSHGLYRFIAWEFIVALFLLNVADWFQEPFSWHQLLSWYGLPPLCFTTNATSPVLGQKPLQVRKVTKPRF